MNKGAFVKLPRDFYYTKYAKSHNVFLTIMWLRYYTRFLPGYVDGIYVDVGQALVSVATLSESSVIPESSIRAVLRRLENDGYIRIEKIDRKYKLITLTDYDKNPAPSTMLKGYSEAGNGLQDADFNEEE